jgi:DNA-binding response OmpR family regulator
MGYAVQQAASGTEALEAVQRAAPEVVLLDLILPDMDGLLLCANLRATTRVPIIVCSGTPRHSERVLALKLGADAFLTKPLDLDELEARIQVLVRRRRAATTEPETSVSKREVRLGALTLDRRLRRITLGERPLRLSSVEFDMLAALASRPNETISREQLAQAAWGGKNAQGERAVEGRIRRLRAKLGGPRGDAPPIVAVRGFGYKLVDRRAGASGRTTVPVG